jgi:hypothetical protein
LIGNLGRLGRSMAALPDTGDLGAPTEEEAVDKDVKMGGVKEEVKGAAEGKAAAGGKKKKKGKK